MATDACAKPSRVKVEEIKAEWKLLWKGRIDDKVRAEGIADQCFSLLAVERGTVISATRDFKELSLKAILRSYDVENVEQVISPHPSVGGYAKFARTVLNKQARVRQFRAEEQPLRHGKEAQLKKGGRGWLHQ